MTLYLKWLGVDFGQCIMDPRGLRNPLFFNDIMKELGKPEEAQERMHRYRRMKEKYGTYGAIKEGHKDEILSFVFDGDEEAMEIFNRKEQEELALGDGLEETLQYLRGEGIICDVVAELKKTLGPVGSDMITKFLETKGIIRYFDYFYSPQCRINLREKTADYGIKGKTKASGELYDYLMEDLGRRGLKVEEAAMIGDKLKTDIEPPRKRGFHTIQFIGYIDFGPSDYAEFRVKSFTELKDFVKPAVKVE
jgi:FMN phosphatase YigB (HAD superfamily)